MSEEKQSEIIFFGADGDRISVTSGVELWRDGTLISRDAPRLAAALADFESDAAVEARRIETEWRRPILEAMIAESGNREVAIWSNDEGVFYTPAYALRLSSDEYTLERVRPCPWVFRWSEAEDVGSIVVPGQIKCDAPRSPDPSDREQGEEPHLLRSRTQANHNRGGAA